MVIGLFDVIVRIIIDLQPQVVNPNMIASSLSHSFIVALISLLRLMEDNHFKQLMDLKSRRDRKDILLQIFFVFNLIFKQDLLPVDWMVMRLISNHVVLCSLQELSITMITDFLYTEEGVSHFDANLWNSFFNLSVCFLTQPCLQLENFSAAKRNSILEKYGDMRVQMGFQILSMWEKLGDLKVNFIPSMVPPFLKVTLVPEKELRRATLPIFYDLIDADFRSNGSFKQVESTLIDQLDQLVSENKGDDEFKQLFMTILLDKVRIQCPPWLDQGVLLINQITKLLELLLDYRHVMDGEENRDKRMSCTVNLLRFYKEEIDRKEMYIRYIYKLADLHLPAENYTEAAYTLKLHADSLSWSWVMMSADKLHGRETMEWQKKESLHLTIIEKLKRGFLDHILNELRPEPEYFRVGFFGHGFPLFLRNKLFIYRGLEYEKIGAFTSRLQNEFPQATIMTKSSPPDEAILSSPCQFIQIVSAKPIADTRPEFDGHEVPEKVTAYYLVNDVKTFVYDRPIHKGPMDKENEFKSLWVERTTLTISSKLPGILRWFEVTQKRVTEVSPLEHACETVENMNVELQKIITSYTSEPTKPISPLSMRLQGVIEAAVNGGVAKYQDAFFNSNYIRLHPDHLRYIKKLKMLILHKVRVLEGGLSLHGRLVPSNMQPLHKRLVERFTVMRHNVKQAQEAVGDYAYGSVDVLVNMKRPSIINQPLPPLPPEAVRSSFDGHYSGPLLDLVTNGRERSEDEIYSVPHDCVSGTPPILPERSFLPAGAIVPPLPPSRPRSAGYSSLEGPGTPPPRPTIMPITLENGHSMSGRPSASILHRSRSIPRTTNHPHVLTHQNSAQNFYSPSPTKEHVNGIHMAFDEPHSPAPALPPRTATLERNRSLAGFSYDSPPSLGDQDRPPLPKRTMRKALSVSLTTPEGPPSLPSVLIPIEMAIGIPETAPPPLPSKRPAPPPPSLSFSSLPAVPLSSTETMRLDAPAPDVISIASCSSITSSSTISGSNSSEQPTVSGFTEMESSSNNESSNCEGTEVPALIESELIDLM
ncbi:Dedicator of cytokinesis protein 4 [Halotydeus destructor]|nr:Dedicator of cytokinesis protein 4 [Halotydeus destructor]